MNPLTDPIPEGEPRRQWTMAETTWRALLDVRPAGGLNADGLERLRRELRGPVWDDIPPDLQERRALLLHDVCGYLMAIFPERAAHYEAVGDRLPSAPDHVPDDLPGSKDPP